MAPMYQQFQKEEHNCKSDPHQKDTTSIEQDRNNEHTQLRLDSHKFKTK